MTEPPARRRSPGTASHVRGHPAPGGDRPGVLVLAAGVGLAVLGYQRFAGNDVEGSIGAYRVLDDQTVSVTISVTRKDPSRPASCIVRARSRDGARPAARGADPAVRIKTVQVTTTVASGGGRSSATSTAAG